MPPLFREFLIARDFLEEAVDHVISVYSFCLSCEAELMRWRRTGAARLGRFPEKRRSARR